MEGDDEINEGLAKTSLGRDIKRLIKKSKKNGKDVGTFGMFYRAHLYSQPWCLIIIPMPAQPLDAEYAENPLGTKWGLGCDTTAAFIARVLGKGSFKRIPSPEIKGEKVQLSFVYELVKREELN